MTRQDGWNGQFWRHAQVFVSVTHARHMRRCWRWRAPMFSAKGLSVSLLKKATARSDKKKPYLPSPSPALRYPTFCFLHSTWDTALTTSKNEIEAGRMIPGWMDRRWERTKVGVCGWTYDDLNWIIVVRRGACAMGVCVINCAN